MGLMSVVRSLCARANRRRLLTSLYTGTIVLAALVVLLVSQALADAANFPDVPSTHAHYEAVADLASRGIIGGYGNGNFGPSDDVTRQQFAKMVVLTGGYPVTEGDTCPFTDVEVGDAGTFYPDNYISVCAAKGITTGKTATTFDPYSNITRYQVITMVVRMADDLRPALLTTPPAGWSGNQTWAANVTHGANAARAEYNGLLVGLNLLTLSASGNMNRGEVAQVLHNLLGKLASTTTTSSATTTSSTTTTSTSSTTTTSSSTTTTTNLHYENLGGQLTSAPAACSWGSDRIDVFARGTEGALWHKWFEGTGWSNWEWLGGVIKAGTDPAAVSWSYAGVNYLHVFVIGPNDRIWRKQWTGSAWSDWEDLAFVTETPSSSPAVAYSPSWFWVNMTWVLYRAPGGSLEGVSYPAQSGSSSATPVYSSLGGTMQAGSSPAAFGSGGSGALDVFFRGTDNALWHGQRTTLGGSWSGWMSLGGLLTSSPAACLCGDNKEVFVRGPDNGLWRKSYTTSWSDWQSLSSGVVSSSPAAVSWGPSRIDVFVRGADGALWHQWWNGSKWLP